MDAKDQRLDPVRCFTVNSLRLDPERWREFVSEEESRVTLSSFFNTQDYSHLFIHQGPEDGLSASLHFPKQQPGDQQLGGGCGRGGSESMETQKNEALVMKAHTGDVPSCPNLTSPMTSISMATMSMATRGVLSSSRGQQVALLLQRADSVYWSTLETSTETSIRYSVKEAEDVTLILRPLQEKLEQVEQMEYQQLGANMAAVMEAVRLVWTGSEFYRRPCRMVVLLQKICNLLVHLSRKFLRGQEVMRGLMSGPGPVLDDVRLVIWTLQSFKEAYIQCRTLLENQNQEGDTHTWDFPSHLVFFHLDNFLTRLHSIQEVLCVSLQLHQLDQVVLSGVDGRMWTDVSFELHLDQFVVQVTDLESRLVSVLSRAFEDCCDSSSAAQNQVRPHLIRLVETVLVELDQTERLLSSQKDRAGTFSRFSPTAAARLCWTQHLQHRAEDAVNSYRTVKDLLVDSGESVQVQQRFLQIVDLLQDFRDQVRSDWSRQLDSVCEFILDQPLIQHEQQGMLGVHCRHQVETALRELRYVSRETDVELHPLTARLLTCRDDITQSYLSLSHMVSCYNQVVSDVLQVERPLIQDQLQDLNRTLSELQTETWTCEGVQHLVEQHRHRVLIFHSTVSEARANMDAMTHIIQGWAELQLLQHSGESLLEGGATEQSYRRIREDGQELLRLTQVNCGLYGAEDSSDTWIRYLDHIDDLVQDGLLQLLLRSLHFLSDNTNPQLQETGSVFEPSVGGGLFDLVKSIITDIYTAANQLARISVSRHGNYQETLQQCQDLRALEQEVMRHMQQVRDEAESLREGLDRYAHLWESDRQGVMHEFLKYGRQIESLHRLSEQVTHLDDVIVLHGWLQVDLRPFRDSLLSIIYDWRHMYTEYLLDSVSDSLQQVRWRPDDDEELSSRFPLTESVILLEAAGVQLPEHLSAHLQVVTSL
ncbi:Dynein heavy chain 11, axonemal Axonemal beta dynein heavy chain 11 Ciliary dynein heavy chain 11 [Larimichthys crocea]|uniref:Dynein heavy chain 11, axonemal Axonemal beta dynein heavy chain 11 Ciliary dynein heavy chain 11 n=1 Tax=Larimichthys crocea TaxID=215358 RepID=A0A6G0IFX1_LARCR|nr:Dynein heavy chain 11, axonemal Axonemal beta dynein heavy chain 11 Ciliary dynein heavy chain 11 [Larimichthys crocea]